MLEKLKRTIILFCLFFTFATLLNSVLNLLFGFGLEIHFHILERAALNFINAVILTMVLERRQKSVFIRFLAQYITVILLLCGTAV